MGIIEKLIARLFLSFFGLFYITMFFFRIIFGEEIDYSEMLINSVYVGLIIATTFFFFSRKHIKLTTNINLDKAEHIRINSKITKDEIINRLNKANKSKYIIENKDNYIKIYTYFTLKSFGELIFISFEKDGILVSSRNLFPAIVDYGKNESNIKFIENLIKET